MNKKIFSLICAVSCSLIWGTAFVAQDMGMDYIGPYTFSAVRLLLGFFTLLPFFFIFEFKKVKETKLSFEKIFIESDNFIIDQYEDNWIVSGPKVDKITNLKGNSHEVLNEISYRFEKSTISNELKNRGIEKGDIVDLNGHEFSYE